MNQAYLAALLERDQKVNPLFTFLGAQMLRVENGEADITLAVGPNIAQGAGLVAGGILATLADEAMAHAVMSLLLPEQTIVTAEMSVRFLRATHASETGLITAQGRVVKMGRSIAVAECNILYEGTRLLATAGATFSRLEDRRHLRHYLKDQEEIF